MKPGGCGTGQHFWDRNKGWIGQDHTATGDHYLYSLPIRDQHTTQFPPFADMGPFRVQKVSLFDTGHDCDKALGTD
jgi:hypothetical protein